jgi:sortase (surface protein transpeptidase)
VRDSLRVFGSLVAAVALLLASAGPGLGVGTSATPTAPPAKPTAALAIRTALEAPRAVISTPAPSPSVTPAPSPALETVAAVETPSETVRIGYWITIPRLGIELQIREGEVTRDIEDQHTPEGYAFHLPGTAWPGQTGNTYLYAHARRGMFLTLWNARPGDEVFILAPDGQLRVYVIRDIFPRVTPTDVSSTQPTTGERLTLQTSTGPNPSDPRFVVFAFPRGG